MKAPLLSQFPADTTTTTAITDATVSVVDPTQQQKCRQEHNGSGGHGGSDADRTTEEGLFHVMVPFAFSPLLPTAGDTTNSVHLPGEDAPLPPPPSGNADVVAHDAAPLALPTMLSSSLMKRFATSVTSNEEGLQVSRDSNLDAATTTEHPNADAVSLSPERTRKTITTANQTSITTLPSATGTSTTTMSGSRSYLHNLYPLGEDVAIALLESAFGNSKTDPSSVMTLDRGGRRGQGSWSFAPSRRLSEYFAESHNTTSMLDSTTAAIHSISGTAADPHLVMTAFDSTSWVDATKTTATTTEENNSRLLAESQRGLHDDGQCIIAEHPRRIPMQLLQLE